MTKKNNSVMTDTDKQNTPLPSEVNPKNAFTKLTILAKRSANKYKLKDFNLEVSSDK